MYDTVRKLDKAKKDPQGQTHFKTICLSSPLGNHLVEQ